MTARFVRQNPDREGGFAGWVDRPATVALPLDWACKPSLTVGVLTTHPNDGDIPVAGYTVRCECGREQAVSGVDAGGEVACGCGRRVPVPSLSRLRAAAGEPTASPELLIRADLDAGALPAEDDCVGCGGPAAGVYRVSVVCERTMEKAGPASGMFVELFTVLVGALIPRVVTLFVGNGGPDREGPREFGRDVRFDLPVRACPGCVRTVAARALVGATPLYARLLEKYPDAAVGRAVG